MSGRDFPIWTRFRDRIPFEVAAWYFNVQCGTPAPPGDVPGAFSDDAWRFITSKRIDAVGETPTRWILLEIRRGASLAAVGAIHGYLLCFRSEIPDGRPAEAWLVTDFLDPDARTQAESLGIVPLEVGA